MHYPCSNQSQHRPRYQPAGHVPLPSAAVRQAGPHRLFCLCIASGSGSLLNFSVLRRKCKRFTCRLPRLIGRIRRMVHIFWYLFPSIQYFHTKWCNITTSTIVWLSGLCPTHESWVKFESTLTQMSRVIVESAVKTRDMNREFHHADRHLSQNWVNLILLSQSWVTDCSEEKPLRFCIYLQRYRERTSLQ